MDFVDVTFEVSPDAFRACEFADEFPAARDLFPGLPEINGHLLAINDIGTRDIATSAHTCRRRLISREVPGVRKVILRGA
jgi:hypothetical protein